jgi:hypothetical protein
MVKGKARVHITAVRGWLPFLYTFRGVLHFSTLTLFPPIASPFTGHFPFPFALPFYLFVPLFLLFVFFFPNCFDPLTQS